MTFLELRQRIAEMAGLDQTDADTDIFLKEWVNDSYKFIGGRKTWPWRLKNDVLQTELEINTGTVSVTQDSTAITFSVGPTPSIINDYRIQFDDSDDWYDIITHTAGATSATLADPFLGTTNAAATYNVRRVYYDLPSDFDRMISMRQSRTDTKLFPMDFRFMDKFLPDPTEVAEPTNYQIIGLDSLSPTTGSNNQFRLVFHPTPNVRMNIDLRFYVKLIALSADTDQPIFQEQWHSIIIFDVLERFAYTFLDDTRQREVKRIKNELLEAMEQNRNPMPDKLLKKMQWDKAILLLRTLRFRSQLPITEV